MANSLYRITRKNHGIGVSGILAVAALAGQLVAVKDQTLASGRTNLHDIDSTGLELSTGKLAFALERSVVASRSTESLFYQDEAAPLSPVVVGSAVSACEILEAEYEGEDFLTLSGAQAISTSTPVNSLLTALDGKLATFTADQIEKQATGRNGAGAQTLAGTRVGDKVRAVLNVTDNTDVTSSFEAAITVAGQVQQSAATDFSAKQLLFIVETPNNLQAPLFRLISFLAPEDAANNTFRIAIQAV